jgi:hypothetical protein
MLCDTSTARRTFPHEDSCDLLDYSNGLRWVPDCEQRFNRRTERFRFWGIDGCWYRTDPGSHVLSPRKAEAPAVAQDCEAILTLHIGIRDNEESYEGSDLVTGMPYPYVLHMMDSGALTVSETLRASRGA